jgi:4-amino-4-deoxy-L-arabinose transferase-like glycosyltransferase
VVIETERAQPAVNQSEAVTAREVLLVLAGLFLLNLLLRVFYLRYDFVNGDEGVRALSAVRMLEGARLYAEVVTDKPPGSTLFYAAIFAAFGRNMKAVHLAATVWNFGTSLVVYLIAARSYGRRTALWAALFFVYFSTNYFTQDTMAANDELLMSLPYTAAFYFFIRRGARDRKRERAASLVAAGLLTGLAAMFKQVGVLNLAFFALYELGKVIGARDSRSMMTLLQRSFGRLLMIMLGFSAVLVLFLLWLAKIHSLGDFWRNGILLNTFYVDAVPANRWLTFLLGRGLGYIFFNATIWLLAIWAVVHSQRDSMRQKRVRYDSEAETSPPATAAQFDPTVALWCGVTLVGVGMGGRFFGHYFIPALPALSLLAARGIRLLGKRLSESSHELRWRLAAAGLAVFFAIGLFRSHHRTAVLAYETITGARTHWSADWGMTRRQQEASVISEFLRSKINPGEPLYIWGYAHDVYWQTGCSPASRYLTPYYIDGRFVDAEATVAETGEEFRRRAAANLVDDLRRAKPRLILDVYSSIQSLPHPELLNFIRRNYRDAGTVGPDAARPFRVFELNYHDEPQSSEAVTER